MSQSHPLSESVPDVAAGDPSGEPAGNPDIEEGNAGEDREPCPTPLEWHDILSRFLQEADHWFLETSVGQIRGRTWGVGPTIYFLNGMSGTHELYALIVWLLREEYRCVLFDYPRSADVTREDLSDLLPQVAKLHGDSDSVTLVTRDFGFQVALMCAARHPGFLSSLICQTPSNGMNLSGSERFLASLGRKVGAKLKRIPGRKMIQQRIHRIWFPPYDPSRFDFYLDNTGEQAACGLAQRFLLHAQPLSEENEKALPSRTLIVRTEGETPYQTRTAEQLQATNPDLQIDWMHTSGQLAFLTHPHRLVKTIKEFLNPQTSS